MTEMKKLFRVDAPDTSIEAALSLPITRLETMIYNAILSAGTNGITADELLQKFPDLSYSSVTARPASLKQKGLVCDSGLRRDSRTGRKQAVLIATEYVKDAS